MGIADILVGFDCHFRRNHCSSNLPSKQETAKFESECQKKDGKIFER